MAALPIRAKVATTFLYHSFFFLLNYYREMVATTPRIGNLYLTCRILKLRPAVDAACAGGIMGLCFNDHAARWTSPPHLRLRTPVCGNPPSQAV